MLSNHRFARVITDTAATAAGVTATRDSAAVETSAYATAKQPTPFMYRAAHKAAYGAVAIASTWTIGTMGVSAQGLSSRAIESRVLESQAFSQSSAVQLVAQGAAQDSSYQDSSQQDSSYQDSSQRRAQTVAAASNDYQTLHVDPALGSDRAEGKESEPLQTVTRALEIASPNTVIVLAPGRYSRASGERFPLQLKSGVTIQGAPGSRERSAIIEGGGTFESPTRSQQNAAILAADNAGIAQVAISNPDGYGVWIESASPTILETAFVGNRQTGIYITEGSPRVQNNYFSGNQTAGLAIQGRSSASIASNIFDSTGDAIRVADGATPEIVGNRIVNNHAGLVLIGDAAPIVRSNQIVGNRQNEVVRVSAGIREQQAIQPQQTPPAARKVPIPADAVPGEMTGGVDNNLPVLAASLPYTPPTQTLAAAEPISRPVFSSRPPMRSAPVEPVAIAPTNEPIEAELVAADLVESAEVESAEIASAEIASAEMENAESGDRSASIPAGAPGAALAALRGDVALAPRAVTGENPDSPVLQRRRDRPRREENREEIDRSIDRPIEPMRSPAPPINNNRLSVPSSRIPLGSGSSTIIFSPPTGGVGGPPAPPSRAQALGLYYRVFVEAADPFAQDEVRAVVPDAFRTRLDGRTVMQVGAFPTENEAEDRQRILEDNGFNAQIEYIR